MQYQPCTNIFERIKKFDFPSEKYAVFGSAWLDIFGIRPAMDLDIIATPELYERLRSDGWTEKQCNGFTLLTKDDANISTVQHRATNRDYCPDRMKLVREAVMLEGCPIVRIDEVIACKTAYDREKDRHDIATIKQYLATHRVNPSSIGYDR